jgi:hypothetical protein
MKRWLLFAGATYYPGGGWDDFIASYDTPDEAADEGRRCLARRRMPHPHEGPTADWYQIVDATTGDVTAFSG